MKEVISELAEKVQLLLETSQQYKEKIERYRTEIFEQEQYISDVIRENSELNVEIEQLQHLVPEKEQIVFDSTNRLKEILNRLNNPHFC